MACNNLALNAHTGYDMTPLAISMSSLILIHEIHIDRVIRKLLIVLRMQMQQRLAKLLQADDPGLCR